jgi:hypothetical protein
MRFIMSETPAPCNFSCKYCYVPQGFKPRKDLKPVTAADYLRLADKLGPGPHLFWMCAIGETFMQPWLPECLQTLSIDHRIGVVTNLSYFGNEEPERACSYHTKNIGMYWSLHLDEMERTNCTQKTLQRVRRMLDAGIRVWPTLVCHPSYYDKLGDAVGMCADLGLKLILCRYRIGQADLAGLPEEEAVRSRFAGNANVDFGLWDRTANCWKVAGGSCTAGRDQIVIDWAWDMCCCHGDGNKLTYGKFPEDIDKLPVTPVGKCKSSKCPCKHSVMFGVNQKFPYTFADILDGWDGFAEGACDAQHQ